ncbi:conserved virulence factor C family protein [Bacillus sp. ISL-40]|uniref:conserved virulence factor C family protein n=1 Tax=unclassified Bacillus (in: firmicutes) TaxID=185979 RepID=UPI001BE5B7B0|nr:MULTISPECIES: conserved virulence factor C family protein [unclassified Bacillus (in: firmicutes)]MBT2699329.1 conserved virulence factor C family protein [Bacillus sp. ISL-40]MBT2723403.1 conserved virulence factor C family protein [Bacillus sp. ISL-46]MBT2739811.1 conserved virulence factor C family protein [Bacillus sp. ISL-77]
MKIKAIEPTPSPNTMKINLDEELPMGKSHNYKKEAATDAPAVIQSILQIEGIKGVYHVADFLAVERNARYDWKELLPQVRQAFGEKANETANTAKIDEHFGEIKVEIQMFKDIPLQVKLTDGTIERRFGLAEHFLKARERAQLPDDNYIFLRKWQNQGVRYGDFDQIGKEVVDELIAAYPLERLEELVTNAQSVESTSEPKINLSRKKVTLEDLQNPDWQIRYQLLEQMDDPELEDLPVLEKALSDEKASIRRLATVYLGMIKEKEVLPLLYQALKDKTVTVRRTAGDCLSDLGFPEAADEMMEALQDKSKLVRWRAAMFLYEAGDEKALPALKAAENDSEFEVSLQIKMAIERIEGGKEAKGSVWKQMTESRKATE